jgi:hypothetical protein
MYNHVFRDPAVRLSPEQRELRTLAVTPDEPEET